MAKKVSRLSKLGTGLKSAFTQTDKRGKTLGNLYTGRKVREGWMTGAIAGGTALGVGVTLSEGTGARLDGNDAKSLNRISKINPMKKVAGTAPPASSQGVAPSILAGGRQPSTQADDLGATGDMVFGAHNNRKGR